MANVLISAGDYSADLHGESLVRDMRGLDPSLFVVALGGIKLKSVADEFLQDMVDLDVSGFSQPILQFFSLKRILHQIVFPQLKSKKLDAVILIDYYGFNIHIAQKAKEQGIPVFYFVSPQVWASRRGRIQKLKSSVTRMLVIFPFEEELYRENGIPATFVGHPLIGKIPNLNHRKNFGELIQAGSIRLGLMPGSRPRELSRHIPLMVECFKKLKEKFPKLLGTLFAVDWIPDSFYRSFDLPQDLSIIWENDYQQRSQLTLSLTASGTATLENALLGIPMVVVYRTSWLTYFVARQIAQVSYISMPNILSKKNLVPELIQSRANPKDFIQIATNFLENPPLLEKMVEGLIQLREELGSPDAYRRAAKIILGALS